MRPGQDKKQYESKLLQQHGHMTGASTRTQIDANNFMYANGIDDPMSSGFKIFFRFDTTHGLLANGSYVNSAIAYLKRIGQSERATLCEKFIEHLKTLSSINPWLMQTIEGLDELKSKKPWERHTEESVISVGTLETIEMTVQTLISMYQNIVWDEERGVWVLPVNLRRFEASIYIYPKGSYMVMDDDPTALGTVPNAKRTYSGSAQAVNESNAHEIYYVKSPDIYNHICYDLSECEFLPWESGSTFIVPDNSGNEVSVNNINFSYRWVKNSYRFYRILGDAIYSDYALALYASTQLTVADQENVWKRLGKQFFSKSLEPIRSRYEDVMNKFTTIQNIDDRMQRKFDLNKLKQEGISILGGLAETAFDAVSRDVAGRLQGMFLGNVYGISHDSFLTGITAQNSSEAIYGFGRTIKSHQQAPSMSSSKPLPPNSNVYSKL